MRARTLLLGLIAGCVAPAPSLASTVYVGMPPSVPAGTRPLLVYQAAPGETNRIAVFTFTNHSRQPIWVAVAQKQIDGIRRPGLGGDACQRDDPRPFGTRPFFPRTDYDMVFCRLPAATDREPFWVWADLGDGIDSIGAGLLLRRARTTERHGGVIAYGGQGSDIMLGSPNDDAFCSGPRSGRECGEDDRQDEPLRQNILRGAAGNDLLIGSEAPDTLDGEAGKDRLSGHAGDDLLLGGPGRDELLGGAGDDDLDTNLTVIQPDDAADGADSIDGGPGTDTAGYAFSASGVTIPGGSGIDGDSWTSIEAIMGTPFDDVISGSPGIEHIYGLGGNDRIDASGDRQADGGDDVSCGDGDDYAVLDRASPDGALQGDASSGCESVVRVPEDPPPPDGFASFHRSL